MDILKNKINSITINPNYSTEVLVDALEPISVYTKNEVFITNINDVVDIVTRDRNGDDNFDFHDIELLCRDVECIKTLIQTIVLIIKSIPNVNHKYTENETEMLIYKLFIYIFLVLVPKKTGYKYSEDELKIVTSLCGNVYALSMSTKIVKSIYGKIGKFVKSSGICSCFSKDNLDMIDDELANTKFNLVSTYNMLRDRIHGISGIINQDGGAEIVD